MNVISKARGEGKTTELIKMSAKTDIPILDWRLTNGVYQRRADEMGVSIPTTMMMPWSRIPCIELSKNVMIDDVDCFLRKLLGVNVKFATATPERVFTKEEIAKVLKLDVDDFIIID